MVSINQIAIKLMIVSSVITNGEEGEIVGGLVGDAVDWLGNKTRESILDFFRWLLTELFNFLQPFLEWGCKSIIVVCILIYYCTNDKRATSVGMKWFFVYLIFCMIRGVIT